MEGFNLPMSFGKKAKAAPVNLKAKMDKTKREEAPMPPPPPPPAARDGTVSNNDDDDDVGPVPPVKRKAGGEPDDDSDDEPEFEDEVDSTPITHEIILKDHTKVISALAVDPSGARIATGSHDYDTKLWDFGGMDSRCKPFKSWEANGNYVVVMKGAGEKGAIVFLSPEDLSQQRRVVIGEGSVVRVLWHSRINQIFAALSTGALHVLYSPHSSIRGALLPLQKMPKTAPRDISFSSASLKPVIYTPDALPMFADEKYGVSLHQKEKQSKRMKPMEPVAGVGKGGRVGASAQQSLVQTMFGENGVNMNEDPREALLKYANKAEEKDEKKK
ncbi:hypothetical protein P7C73_g2655, partial [Tremellales sp. Uapishka_1]